LSLKKFFFALTRASLAWRFGLGGARRAPPSRWSMIRRDTQHRVATTTMRGARSAFSRSRANASRPATGFRRPAWRRFGCGIAGAKKLHGFHSFTLLRQSTPFVQRHIGRLGLRQRSEPSAHRSAISEPASGRSERAPPEAYHAETPPRRKRASKPRSMSVFVTLRPTSKP
jgi:hypothetical protein